MEGRAMRTTIATVAAVTTIAGFGFAAAPAMANDDDVIRRGPCSGSSDWKLKASPEDGRIEVEGEVDSNKVGQTWRWRILHNGEVSARGKKTTKAPSGSFEVRRLLVDLRGDDGIGWRARNPKSGEVCRGRLVF
jgi:hypothetical protein